MSMDSTPFDGWLASLHNGKNASVDNDYVHQLQGHPNLIFRFSVLNS